MTAADGDTAARRQRGRTSALWRWSLIERAMDDALTSRQRGAIVRDLAGREHAGPWRSTVPVSRKTTDGWITARRAGGFDALVPAPRQSSPRTDPQVVELAVGLKRENPARTAAQVRRVLAAQLGWAPSERAIQRWFEARELTTRPGGRPPQAYRRLEAGRGNEMLATGLVNPPPAARRPRPLAPPIAHPRPHPARPLVPGLDELNELLGHWVREVYHQRVHSETGQSPRDRYQAAGQPASPDAALLREAFSWSAVRLVRKTATVDLEGNTYSVDPFLTGRKVELGFDPFDMTRLALYR